MKKVLVLLAPGFEEIEAVTAIDVLRRADIAVTIAGTQEGAISGSRKVAVLADVSVERVSGGDFDLIFLPGGQPGTDHLHKSDRVRDILEEAHRDGRMIAAICAAPAILAEEGYLKGRQATSHPCVKSVLDASGAHYSDAPVVVDGPFVTSRSPGTAMECALVIVRQLLGDAVADKVGTDWMAAP
jgi:4-methyl-5(b-hydroxyethyl)-thiazole monophosphate biosynthesis